MFARLLCIGFVAAASLAVAVPARAGDPGLDVPRFASLSADKVYLRQGPTYQNRILWVYRRKGLPVEIVAQYAVWRRVRMPDGATGWVHVAMLSSKRTVVITGKAKAPIRDGASPHARILALAQPGVIAKLDHCEPAACEIDVAGTDGWIAKKNVWGVTPGEKIR